MLSTIWDDINNDIETIVISDIKYRPESLSNIIYEIIDNPIKLRDVLRKNKVKGLYSDIPLIQSHFNCIQNDMKINTLCNKIIKDTELSNIDRLFINCYYRKLLRTKLEQYYSDRELIGAAIITENAENDIYIVKTLQYLKIICKFLGINNTFTSQAFDMEKLKRRVFWSNISEKFINLFGEERIYYIDEYKEEDDNIEAEAFRLLNNIFGIWSGSRLIITGSTVTIMPSIFITRLISKIKDIN